MQKVLKNIVKNMKYDKVILVTGGCGFIGANFLRYMTNKYPNYYFVNFDVLTYAGNFENLKEIENLPNYTFVKGDITDYQYVMYIFKKYEISHVIHFAAESHVDRSIKNPSIFVNTNVIGTVNLLNAAREFWTVFPFDLDPHRFHHVSTDEVYGSLDMNPENKFREDTPYSPHSPYSASKAASDFFVKAYHDTYGIDVTISNCSNNYGPYQFPEKLIPLVIHRLETGDKIPIYGTGENVRDWLYVEDHVKAIDIIFHEGKSGETYNVGGNQEKTNLEIVKHIIDVYNDLTGKGINKDDVINFIKDPRGDAHDLRYAIDSAKLQTDLVWSPEETFETGIKKTIQWYLDNKKWVKNGE